MTYMLDTNICVYAMKNHPPQVEQAIRERMDDGLCISAITLAELEHGVQKSQRIAQNTEALLKFLTIIEVLPFDDVAAVEYGKIQAYLQKNGTPIGTADALIAGHARSEGLVLVTNNVREFARVPELKVENWAE
ncbi:type II toxin-antitoxin system tRNA(fMet)-specific endonuclease VapC [Acutalibacter sp. 1XD8-36]|uniref:type II toxin-antitoxin system tRNA(fMet)-specific endonuclease VapC n=1 Tax=Acutalibacter sp. 1XD8-36 TaxID=2320852 RepID=UPI0014125F10|nr:type II toxin-antitoxin system VapC family toxin [Acutalibacter sp. 1XD8-36]NBJ90158.1 type II toxin-antitoxin system VapC family toxin [Acutalibacter sp. 1XD8-36]